MTDYCDYAEYVMRAVDNARIPRDPGNCDYQGYLKWREEGNTPDTPPAPTLAERKDLLKAAVTEKRWEIEEGGVGLPDGTRILTAKTDQNRITSVVVNAQLAGIASVDFKAETGWMTLSLDQITGIAGAVARHVQACFSAERVHHDAIALLDAVTIETYDVEAGWPSAMMDAQGRYVA